MSSFPFGKKMISAKAVGFAAPLLGCFSALGGGFGNFTILGINVFLRTLEEQGSARRCTNVRYTTLCICFVVKRRSIRGRIARTQLRLGGTFLQGQEDSQPVQAERRVRETTSFLTVRFGLTTATADSVSA
jgi:hypothetical protein